MKDQVLASTVLFILLTGCAHTGGGGRAVAEPCACVACRLHVDLPDGWDELSSSGCDQVKYFHLHSGVIVHAAFLPAAGSPEAALAIFVTDARATGAEVSVISRTVSRDGRPEASVWIHHEFRKESRWEGFIARSTDRSGRVLVMLGTWPGRDLLHPIDDGSAGQAAFKELAGRIREIPVPGGESPAAPVRRDPPVQARTAADPDCHRWLAVSLPPEWREQERAACYRAAFMDLLTLAYAEIALAAAPEPDSFTASVEAYRKDLPALGYELTDRIVFMTDTTGRQTASLHFRGTGEQADYRGKVVFRESGRPGAIMTFLGIWNRFIAEEAEASFDDLVKHAADLPPRK